MNVAGFNRGPKRYVGDGGYLRAGWPKGRMSVVLLFDNSHCHCLCPGVG